MSLRRNVTVNVAPPSGLLWASRLPPCASTIVRAIVSPIPSPCAFVVTNGVNSVPLICAGRPVPVSRTETFDVGGPDFGSDRDATPRRRCLGHRVHGVHHQVHEHLLQEHLIAADDARIRRQIDGCLDLPRLMSWATRARLSEITV